MTTSKLIGTRALALAELLFGREPADRYVAPAVADWQAAHAETRGIGQRLALRLRFSATLALTFLFIASRTQGDGALARLWPALLASILGALVVRRAGVDERLFGRQLEWLAVGIIVFFALASRKRLHAKPALLAVGMAAVAIGLVVTDSTWWRLPMMGNLVVSPIELLKVPALLASIAVATERGPKRFLAGAALVLVCAGMVHVHEPQSACIVVATALGALAASGSFARRAALTAAALALGSVVTQLPARTYPEPAPHTDLITLSTFQHFGGLGVALLAAAFTAIFFMLARQARSSDPAASTAASALFAGLGAQVALHLSGAFGLGPVLGVALPLASYGGSATVALYASLAIVLATARAARGPVEAPPDVTFTAPLDAA